MSFFVTLPSSASFRELPSNRQTNFTTLFHHPIRLDGVYEVALTEMTYSSRYSVELGELEFFNPFISEKEEAIGRVDKFRINLSTLNATQTLDFVESLNKKIETQIVTSEYYFRDLIANNCTQKICDLFSKHLEAEKKHKKPSIYIIKKVKSLEIVCAEENPFSADFVNLGFKYDKFKFIKETSESFLDEKFSIIFLTCPEHNDLYKIENYYTFESEHPPVDPCHLELVAMLRNIHFPHFRYQKSQLIIDYFGFDFFVIKGLFAAVLGVFSNEDKCSKTSSFPIMDSLRIINNAVVYSDIIEDQIFGDALAPVLYSVCLKSSTNGENVTTLDNPHYIQVKKSIISSINIRILDLTGEPIRFSDIFSPVILKLHFRKK